MSYHDPLSNQEAVPLQQPLLGNSSSEPSSQRDVHHSQPYPQNQDLSVSSSHAPTLQPELHQQNLYGQAPPLIAQQDIVYRGAVPMNAQMSTDATYHSLPNPQFTSIGAGFQHGPTNQTSGSSTKHPKGSSSLNQAALIEQKIKSDFGFYTCMLYIYAAYFTYNGGAVIGGFIFYKSHILFYLVDEPVIIGSFILVSLIFVGLCVAAIKAKLDLNAKLQYWTYISLFVLSVFVLLGTLMISPPVITQAAKARAGMLARMIIIAVVVFYVLNFVLVYYARTISRLMDERSHLLNNSSDFESSQNVSNTSGTCHNMSNPDLAPRQTPDSFTSHSMYSSLLNQAVLIVLKIKNDFGVYTCMFYAFAVVFAFGLVALVLKFIEMRYINIDVVPAVALSWLASCVVARKAKSNLNAKLHYWIYIVQCVWSVFILVYCLVCLFLMIQAAMAKPVRHYHYTHHPHYQDNDSAFSFLMQNRRIILAGIVLNALNFVLVYYTRTTSKLMDERSHFLNNSSNFESSQNIGSENLLLKEAASIEQRISRNFDCYTCVICFQTLWAVLDFIAWIADGKVSRLISLLYIGGGILALKAKSSFSSKQQLCVFVLLCIKAASEFYQAIISSSLYVIGNLTYLAEENSYGSELFVPINILQVLANPLLMYYGYRLRKLMKERDCLLNKVSSSAKSIQQ